MSFKWYGDAIQRQIINTVNDKLYKCGLDLKQESVDQAPVDSGDLRGNCAVDSDNNPNGATVTVGYSLPYALIQHESLGFNHPQGGKSKYLEDPFNANKDQYIKYCGTGVVK